MGFFESPVSSQDPEVAASKAVGTATKWVARAIISTSIFLTSLYFVLFLLYKQQLLEKQPVQIAVGAVLSLVMAGLALRYPWDQISTDIRAAILAAAGEKIREYREQNPSVSEIEKIQLQDFSCIPNIYKTEEAIRLSSQNRSIHNRRVGRDAIIKGLAYNDGLLRDISLAVVDETLLSLNRSRRTSRQLREVFLTDIYSYLKGWLMLSIMYNHTMPIRFIPQRYPDEKKPDRKAYKKAIEIIKLKLPKNQEILQALRPYHSSETDYSSQAIELLEEYLEIMANELSHASH